MRLLWSVLRQLAFPLLTISSVLGLAFLMNYSGATATLGLAFAATGALFPFFSALLGWLGVFLTGSDTSANALFGSLQVVTANQLGFEPAVMASANSAGGVMGKMISLQSLAVAVAATGKHVMLMVKFALRSAIAAALLGAILFVVVRDNPVYQDRLEGIIVGRAERSSEGRFTLWQRGLETLQASDTIVLGIGPENFRDVDFLEKQLHNDLLAFSVERGLLGALGLVLFAAVVLFIAACLARERQETQNEDN